MSYNTYGYAHDWSNDTSQQPLGDASGSRRGDGEGALDSTLGDWSHEQLLPEAWDPQRVEQPLDSFPPNSPSATVDSRSSRALRYEPYHVPPNPHALPHRGHVLPVPPSNAFTDFDLSNPAFLISANPGTLHDWRGDTEPARRDSDSTRSAASRENSDPTALIATSSKRQNYDSLPTLDPGEHVGETVDDGSGRQVDKKVVKKADKSCRKCRYVSAAIVPPRPAAWHRPGH